MLRVSIYFSTFLKINLLLAECKEGSNEMVQAPATGTLSTPQSAALNTTSRTMPETTKEGRR